MDTRITEFVNALNAKWEAEADSDYRHTLTIDPNGRKYIRLVKTSGFPNAMGRPQRSVFAFVDADTMDILKPAGWQAPAKHARASIATPEAMANAIALADPYGTWLYIR